MIPVTERHLAISAEEYLRAAGAMQPDEPFAGFTARQQGLPTRDECEQMREIFEHAMTAEVSPDEPELSIPYIHMLPTRCIIGSGPGLVRICSDELIRIQSTGEYPSVEDHLAGTSPAAEPWKPPAEDLMEFVLNMRKQGEHDD